MFKILYPPFSSVDEDFAKGEIPEPNECLAFWNNELRVRVPMLLVR